MSNTALDLFAEFPEAASIHVEETRRSRAKASFAADESHVLAARRRREFRRANSSAQLAEILPTQLEPGVSYHVISRGDIDARSYIEHVLATQPLDHLLVSTWCMAMDDLEFFEAGIAADRIGQLAFYVGEIFPSQYPDEFLRLRKLCRAGRTTFAVARNHSKIMAGIHEASGFHVVSESSANVNTNPRIEQTTLTRDESLYWHYRDFFDGIRSIYRDEAIP
jgi:hypothetical protein